MSFCYVDGCGFSVNCVLIRFGGRRGGSGVFSVRGENCHGRLGRLTSKEVDHGLILFTEAAIQDACRALEVNGMVSAAWTRKLKCNPLCCENGRRLLQEGGVLE